MLRGHTLAVNPHGEQCREHMICPSREHMECPLFGNPKYSHGSKEAKPGPLGSGRTPLLRTVAAAPEAASVRVWRRAPVEPSSWSRPERKAPSPISTIAETRSAYGRWCSTTLGPL